jgi:hypothetical protein
MGASGQAHGGGASSRGAGPGRDRGRQRILEITDMVPFQHEGLRRALEPFGGTDELDAAAYVAARASRDFELYDRTALAERYWSVLQNLLTDLAALGLAEARRLGVHEVRRAGPSFEGLADLGVLSRPDAMRLSEIQGIRNDDQHMYPAEVRRLVQAMLDLDTLVARFMAAYGRWFASWPQGPG